MSVFEEHRKRLFGIAYRMLGSAAEADDLVQETFIRWQAADHAAVETPSAFLTTIITRLALDRLKEASVRRETYMGPWLPEPIATTTDSVELAESISFAFLVLLESLSPLERAAYLLHEVFSYSHDEVAAILDRDVAACRKLFERARTALHVRRPRFAPSREAHQKILGGFAVAIGTGDLGALERLLAVDVQAFSDGGGKVSAARKPVLGRENVARFYAGLGRFIDGNTASFEVIDVNGLPAMLIRNNDKPYAVVQLETDGEQIFAIRATLNPDKLLLSLRLLI